MILVNGMNSQEASVIYDANGQPLARVAIDANWPYNENAAALNVTTQNGAAGAHESLSVTNGASVYLTAATYLLFTKAMITVETAEIRYMLHGVGVTTTTGHVAAAGSTILLNNALDIAHFNAIASSSSATIRVTYFY